MAGSTDKGNSHVWVPLFRLASYVTLYVWAGHCFKHLFSKITSRHARQSSGSGPVQPPRQNSWQHRPSDMQVLLPQLSGHTATYSGHDYSSLVHTQRTLWHFPSFRLPGCSQCKMVWGSPTHTVKYAAQLCIAVHGGRGACITPQDFVQWSLMDFLY
jgi:hypothetical protein